MKKRFLLPAVFGLCFPVLALAAVMIQNPLSSGTVLELLQKITDGVRDVVAGIGIIALLISAVLFVTAAGNEQQYTKAKDALKYAIIGMAVGLGASALSLMIQQIIGVK